METPQSSDETKTQSSAAPAPEALLPQDETGQSEAAATPAVNQLRRSRRNAYRPSHRAAFIGIAVVVIILAVNAVVIGYVLRKQSVQKDQAQNGMVTVGQGVLDKLGVNRGTVGDKGVELVVNPNSRFNGRVQMGGDVSVAGELKLNSKFSATDASLSQLQAGNTSLQQLNVNGDGTITSLSLRRDLTVTGTTRLQGDVTLARPLTVNNNALVAGNLSVGGSLTANNLQMRSLAVTSTLTVGGHIITNGAAPAVRPGNALGSNGTVSISGNDAAGTVAANIGTGAQGGVIASVTFVSAYGNIPRVVVSAVGAGVGSVYTSRSATGFSIGVNGPTPPGGYAFDYIVMQ